MYVGKDPMLMILIPFGVTPDKIANPSTAAFLAPPNTYLALHNYICLATLYLILY